MKQKNKMVFNVGTTSLILIFTVLALVTFALLSLSGASAQKRLAEKMADRTTRYYTAENQAYQILERVQELVAVAWEKGKDRGFLEEVQAAAEQEPDLEWKDGKICWTVAVSEEQNLVAQAVLVAAKDGGTASADLVEWHLEETGTWEKDDTMELFLAENIGDE
ncbi:MAG: hypothetical protein PHR92_10785 [Lachnospiraceae bacterium]|nr:hypothetical protein [Lachnospiraceae bacterium]